MARLRTEPAIPSAQEALLAREVSRELETRQAAGQPLRLQVAVRPRGNRAGPAAGSSADAHRYAERDGCRARGDAGAGRSRSDTQQAADLLNVSRPYVVSLIGKGVLPVRMVGNQRRVPLKELLAYKAKSTAKAFDALEEMSAIDQELGLR